MKTKLLVLACFLFPLIQNVFADGDIVTDATNICIQKDDMPLTQCPEYISAIKQVQKLTSKAVADPQLKSQNQAAINQATRAAEISAN